MVLESGYHINFFESGASSLFCGVNFNLLYKNDGTYTVDDVICTRATKARWNANYARTALIVIENTIGARGGTVFPFDDSSENGLAVICTKGEWRRRARSSRSRKKKNVGQVATDNKNARRLFERTNTLDTLQCTCRGTNMVYVNMRRSKLSPGEPQAKLQSRGILSIAWDESHIRFMTNMHVDSDDIDFVAKGIASCLSNQTSPFSKE